MSTLHGSWRRLVPLVVAGYIAACQGTTLSISDEIHEDEVWLPKGAKAGMFAKWQVSGADLISTSLACVADDDASVTMEWRDELADGTVVTAARFTREGKLITAWRGWSGGPGKPLRIEPARSLEDTLDQARRNLSSLGKETELRSMIDLERKSELSMKTVEVPAGKFDCTYRCEKIGLLTIETWWSRAPLPLSIMVKSEMRMTFCLIRNDTLVEYGWQGATASLQPPNHHMGIGSDSGRGG